jgi:hypothetical protein
MRNALYATGTACDASGMQIVWRARARLAM